MILLGGAARPGIGELFKGVGKNSKLEKNKWDNVLEKYLCVKHDMDYTMLEKNQSYKQRVVNKYPWNA